ncbi:MAG: hypothetical protein ACW960_09640 [Candidatus Thorarchaeota archaeon]
MAWYENENINLVAKEHFEHAIRLADECEAEKPNTPRVGAVVVKDGEIIAESHRNMTGSGDHAEFIAFEQRGVDKVKFKGADLITTLEPCTEKRHGKEKKSCAEWVILRRIRKVWIGVLDRNPHIRGKAVMMFNDLGISVGWFPDDLVPRILKQNEDFFNYARMMTPQLSTDDLEERRIEVRNLVQHELTSYKDDFRLLKQWLQPTTTIESTLIAGADLDIFERPDNFEIIGFAQQALDALQDSLSRLMNMNIHDAGEWTRLGYKLLLAHEISFFVFRELDEPTSIKSHEMDAVLNELVEDTRKRLCQMSHLSEPIGTASAGRALDTALKLDGTYRDAIVGTVIVEMLKGEDFRAFEFLESVRQYLPKSDDEISSFYAEVARRLRKEEKPQWQTAYSRARTYKPS